MRGGPVMRASPLRLPCAALLTIACIFGSASMARAADTRAALADTACKDLRAAAAAIPGRGPMLLPSYPTVRVAGDPSMRALAGAAYVYDNAAAGVALSACGAPEQARRIADALLGAPSHDPAYTDGRLRNAYQAGATPAEGPALPGYWSDQQHQWMQDAYQVSTATGNAAWAALLFLDVYATSRDARYLDAAIGQLRWIDSHTRNATEPAGYAGGVFGFDRQQQPQHWKSTEQNLDVHAAAIWALRYRKDPALEQQARLAGDFVRAMWSDAEHRFNIGTLDDGHTLSRNNSGLDAQVWPLLAFADASSRTQWASAWRWIDRHHGSGAGYGYRRNPQGLWTEGTAQAAAAMQASGRTVPETLWKALLAQQAPSGLFYATPDAKLRTDLAIGPTSTTADFYYYHLPHLGATAWVALAAKGVNPFTGMPITPAPASTRPVH